MNEKQIWDRLYASIQNPFGVAGVMGNFQAESAMRANNLQDCYQGSLGMNDEQYTAAVDSGSYGNFVHDSAGYGLYQATFWSIKEHLLNYARAHGKSIGDWQMQVDQFIALLKEQYSGVWNTLVSATSVRQASDAVLLKFERPADQSAGVQVYRAGLGQNFFDQFAGTAAIPVEETPSAQPQPEPELVSVNVPVLARDAVSNAVSNAQALLIRQGYACGGRIINGHEQPDGIFGPTTEKAVRDFQSLKGLASDGVIGADTWTALLTT